MPIYELETFNQKPFNLHLLCAAIWLNIAEY